MRRSRGCIETLKAGERERNHMRQDTFRVWPKSEGEKSEALWRVLGEVEIKIRKCQLKESQTGACVAQT